MLRRHNILWNLIAAVLTLAWLLCAAPCPGAAAEDDGEDALEISFSIKPGEMVSPGDTTMTFVITNHSERDVQNVYLSSADGLLSEPIGQIGAGESQTLVRLHSVTQAELDAGFIAYTISHDSLIPGSQKVIHPVSAAIVKGAPRPNVDFTRQLSSASVAPGGLVTVIYRITNTGNVTVSGIRIRDSLGDYTGRLEQLAQGESKTFISRVAVNAEGASEPVLEYAMPSGESYTVRLDAAPIRMVESSLEMSFSVGQSVFDESVADAILTLTNTGDADYANLTVTDDIYGGIIADVISLPKGTPPVEIAFTYPLRGESQFRWRVSGTSETGDPVNLLTDTVTLEDAGIEPTLSISLDASTPTPRISTAGVVTFDISVSNSGSAMAEDALVYEVNRGEIRRFAVIPGGEPSRCSASYEVRSDAQFIFCLNYTDAEGRQRTISTAPIDITIGPGGATPGVLPEDAATLEGSPFKVGNSTSLSALLIGVSAALLLLFALLLVTSIRQRRGRRERQAAERQRQKEEMGKTNPFQPIKRRGLRKRS